jgi:hypothetical protein
VPYALGSVETAPEAQLCHVARSSILRGRARGAFDLAHLGSHGAVSGRARAQLLIATKTRDLHALAMEHGQANRHASNRHSWVAPVRCEGAPVRFKLGILADNAARRFWTFSRNTFRPLAASSRSRRASAFRGISGLSLRARRSCGISLILSSTFGHHRARAVALRPLIGEAFVKAVGKHSLGRARARRWAPRITS